MAGLDSLPPDQRAVLQLVLGRGQTYDEIAEMLSIDRAGVRTRALEALDAIAPESELDPVRRGLITDYLLGQLPEAVAGEVGGRLATHPGERAWARVAAGELMPLGADRLPEIPAPRAAGQEPDEDWEDGPAPHGAPATDAPSPAARAAGRRRARAERRDDDRRAEERRREVLPLEFDERRVGERRSATEEPREDTPSPRRESSRLGGAILIGGGIVIAVAIILAIVLSGGSSKSRTTTSASATTTRATTSTATASARPIAQVNLTAPGGGKTPVGAAVVVRQGNQTGLVIRAQGLTPNSAHDAYAVWLSNPSGSPSQILGFVNPGVGKTGVLQTAGALPAGAAQYKELLVTLETQAKPKTPGRVVLQGALSITG